MKIAFIECLCIIQTKIICYKKKRKGKFALRIITDKFRSLYVQKNMFHLEKIRSLFAIIAISLIGFHVQAQMTGWVEIPVSVTGNNRPIENAEVEVSENGVSIQPLR